MRRNGPLPSMLAATLALAVCAAAGEPDHRLKDYPDLPKITVDGPHLTLAFPDRTHSVVRPLIPKLDLDRFPKKSYVDSAAALAEALKAAGPGTAILLRAGTYEGPIAIRTSGTAEQPLLLAAAPGEVARIVLRHADAETVRKNQEARAAKRLVAGPSTVLVAGSYVWVYGLLVEGNLGRLDESCDRFSANGITLDGHRGQWIANNVVYRNAHCGIKEMGHGGTAFTIEGNVIFENGKDSCDHGIYVPSNGATIRGNVVFNNWGYGVHLYSTPSDNVVERNVCFGHRAAGIIVGGARNRVVHNTCVHNGIGLFYFRGGCVGNTVENNVIAFNKTDCGFDNGGGAYGDPKDNLDDFNCYFPGKLDPHVKGGGHEVFADPLFEDAERGDFRLKAASPCRDAGTGLGQPFDGKAPDLGAFETQ